MLVKEDYKARLHEITELKGSVTLDIDPIAAGLTSFNAKLAQLQAIRERVTSLLTEAIWNKTAAQNERDSADFIFSAKYDHLLTTDKTVQTLKSADLRKAKLNDILNVELASVHQTTKIYSYADAYLKNVYAIEKELEVKNNNLLTQINTVKIMLHVDPALRDDLKYKA